MSHCPELQHLHRLGCCFSQGIHPLWEHKNNAPRISRQVAPTSIFSGFHTPPHGLEKKTKARHLSAASLLLQSPAMCHLDFHNVSVMGSQIYIASSKACL